MCFVLLRKLIRLKVIAVATGVRALAQERKGAVAAARR
jgi:hypothetical protein